MPRTNRQLDDDARLAHQIVLREARPVLPHVVRDAMFRLGRPLSDMAVRTTLRTAARLGLLRQVDYTWEATNIVPTPPEPPDPDSTRRLATELVQCAAMLLQIRPCVPEVNDAARRIYAVVLALKPGPTPAPSDVDGRGNADGRIRDAVDPGAAERTNLDTDSDIEALLSSVRP